MKAYCINLPERPERWEQFQKQKFPFPVERFLAIRDIPGWKGCAKSHLKLMGEIKEFPCAIFEDDCLMLDSWERVEEVMKQLPENWDMLYLGATLNEQLERYSENLFKLKNAFTTHCIIYRDSRVIDFMLKSDIDRKIDVFITKEVHTRFNCFVTYPMIATQRAGISDIGEKSKYVTYNEIELRFKKYTT
jgi:glycosyl transferase, family 25